MPGNEIAEKVHNFFEQDRLSQGQHQPQIASGNWSALNNNIWLNNQRQNAPPHFSQQKNYDVQSSDAGKDSENINVRQSTRMHPGPNFSQLTLRPEITRSQQLNTNGFRHDSQGFQIRSNEAEFLEEDILPDRHNLALRNSTILQSQQGRAQEHNPGITSISERLESIKAPVNFDFLGSQHQLMRGQQSGISQPQPRQQPGLNDLPLWQQHLVYKQMQEIQRQRRLQQLDQEARQQNSSSQLSAVAKPTAGDPLPHGNGASIHNASSILWPGEIVHQMGVDPKVPIGSQAFMVGNVNWARSGSSTVQGFPNGFVLSHDQGQGFRSMGFLPQQLDQSSYGASIGSTRNAMIRPSNPYSNFQGISHSGPDMLAKTGGSQVAKAVMQSNALSSFQADESSMFPEQVCIEDGVSVSKQNIHGRNLFGHAHNVLQNPNSGIVPGNFQQLGSLPRNSQFQEFHGRQERAGWPGSSEEKESLQVGPSQGLVNLDLTEEKVLYNTGDSIWDPAGGYVQNSQLEGADFLNMFPSVQSGSWSALMQSAVAEASSSDTGLQDEWSGLSFQKTELSTGNPQLSDSGKQPTVWGDQNMPTAPSLTSRPFPLFDESNMSPNGQPASGFEQTTPKFMYEQSERAEGEPQAIHGVTSESLQQSTGLPNKWLDHSPQQKHLVEGKLPTHVHSENTAEGGWASQIFERTGSVVRSEDMDLDVQNMHSPWVPQQRASSYKANSSQPCNKSNEWNINESLLPNRDNLQSCDNAQGHIYRDDNRVTVPFSNKGVGMEQVKRGTGSPQVHSEDDSGNSFAPVPSSNMLKSNQENNQQTLNSRQLECSKHTIVDSSAEFKGNENVGRFQNQPSKHSQFQDPSMNCSDRASSERHDRKREKNHQKDSSNDNFISNNVYHLQQTVTGGGGERQSYWLSGSDSRPVVGGNQRSSGQVARKPSVRRFQYHPMGNLDVDVTQTTTMEHATHSQAVSQPVSREPKAQGTGYYGHPKFVGAVASGNVVDMEKGHMAADSQSNPKGVEDALSKGVVPGFNSTVSASFDGSIAFYNPNKRTVQTSPNMLELLNKVDQPRETNLMRFGSSKMSEPAGSNSSAADLQQNQSPASQGFGLRLAPPSQRIPISKLSLSSQTSQTVNDLNSQHIDPEVGYRGQTFLPTPVTGQSLPSSYEISQREHWGSKSSLTGHTVESHSNFQENASTTISTGLHYSQDQLEHQQISSSSKQITTDQPTNISSEVHFRQTLDTHDEQLAESASASALAFSDKFLSCERSSDSSHSQPMNINSSHLDPPPVSQASVTLGTSQQGSVSTMLHNVWTDRSAQQCVPGGTHKASPSLVSSIPSSSSSLEPTSWIGQKVDEQKNIGKGGSCPSEFGPCSINAQQFVSGDEQPVKDNSLKHMLPERDRVTRTRFPFSPANFPSTAEYNLPPQTVSGSLFQSLGQEPLAKHPSNANSVTSSSAVVHLHQDIGTESHVQDSSLLSQKEHSSRQQSPASDRNFEVLKNSGKPSGSLHNYSLLNQMQAMKSAGTDPNMKNVKRLKVEEYGTDGLQVAPTTSHRFMYGYSTIATDPIDNHPKAEQDAPRPSADGKRLSFSMEGAENPNVNRDFPSKDITGGNDPQNHSSSHFSLTSLPSSLRVAEYSQLNPQVAPSWFGQFGTYKNEQILDMYDGLGAPRDSAKATSQQYLVGSASGSAHGAVEEGHADIANHVGTMVQSTSSIVAASENIVLTQSSLPDTGHQSFTLVRLKKRKILAPWHKEVVQSSHKIRSISMAELEWAHVANRRIEKMDDEAEMMDDGPSMSRQRRRLILTTQLMQQLIRAVPTSILSAEASSDYESVTYLVAKIALRDACSLISCSGSDSNVQPYNENSTSGRPNTSERVGGQIISKFVEDYIGRTKKLENDLLRLNERAFFLDLRVECQELEKFFIINRFARYHGRSQSDGVSSLSATDAAAVRKPFPQRYVTALSMPRKLPEGMLCLSL